MQHESPFNWGQIKREAIRSGLPERFIEKINKKPPDKVDYIESLSYVKTIMEHSENWKFD